MLSVKWCYSISLFFRSLFSLDILPVLSSSPCFKTPPMVMLSIFHWISQCWLSQICPLLFSSLCRSFDLDAQSIHVPLKAFNFAFPYNIFTTHFLCLPLRPGHSMEHFQFLLLITFPCVEPGFSGVSRYWFHNSLANFGFYCYIFVFSYRVVYARCFFDLFNNTCLISILTFPKNSIHRYLHLIFRCINLSSTANLYLKEIKVAVGQNTASF